MRVALVLAGLLLGLALSGCDMLDTSLRIHIADHRQFDAAKIGEIFEEQSSLDLEPVIAPPGSETLKLLTSNQADLGLVENSVAFVKGVRAILPVFESVLHVAYHKDFDPERLQQPLYDARFHVAYNSMAGREFVELVTKRQGLTPDDYSITSSSTPGDFDILVYFGPIDPDRVDWMPPDYSLISLNSEFNPQNQFYEDGIGYIAPNMKPKVIPALTYELPGNEKPLLTVSVDTLLVTRAELPASLVYRFTKTLIEQKPRLAAVQPAMFGGINDSFDPLDLSFPLHTGARGYINRDEPGLLERYAETINLLVYIAFLLITGFIAFGRWRNHQKKDRIDVFYQRVFEIRDRIGQQSADELLAELDALEREAFDSLIREKLLADESFRIFTELLGRLRYDLQSD